MARDTWTPAVWGGLAPMATNLVLDALVYRRFGLVGIAAVTSAQAALVLVVLSVLLVRRHPGSLGAGLARGLLRALAGCAAIAAVGWAVPRLVSGDGVSAAALRLAGLAALSTVAYLAVTSACGSPEARELWGSRRPSSAGGSVS
jgi:peptidoglycan biosynthesis protein MviN/MurJ (putative lipid II flippase)